MRLGQAALKLTAPGRTSGGGLRSGNLLLNDGFRLLLGNNLTISIQSSEAPRGSILFEDGRVKTQENYLIQYVESIV